MDSISIMLSELEIDTLLNLIGDELDFLSMDYDEVPHEILTKLKRNLLMKKLMLMGEIK
tara:strand:+ start:932 stop:1108 length:177 start_codon:yes stop_codon:yes gene_type:complete